MKESFFISFLRIQLLHGSSWSIPWIFHSLWTTKFHLNLLWPSLSSTFSDTNLFNDILIFLKVLLWDCRRIISSKSYLHLLLLRVIFKDSFFRDYFFDYFKYRLGGKRIFLSSLQLVLTAHCCLMELVMALLVSKWLSWVISKTLNKLVIMFSWEAPDCIFWLLELEPKG